MKILIDARMYGLEHTGVGRYIMKLVQELRKIDKKNNYVLVLRKKYFYKLKLPNNWTKVLADYRHYTFAEQIKLPGLIKKSNPDIVHFPHFNIPVLYKGKFIVTIHDMIMHRQAINATKLPLPLYLVKRLPYKYIFRKAIESSVSVITPTKTIKKEIVNYYKIPDAKISVIYEGAPAFDTDSKINTDNFKILSKYNIKKPYFIYVGNAYPHKNLERLVEAILMLNRNRKEKVHMVLATSGNIFTQRLSQIIKSLNAEEFVKLLRFVTDAELEVLLANSCAFVYPSLSEGFGLQGLESIAAGTLVLASDISVFKEVYEDNVVYFNPYDFASLAKVMKDALEMDKDLRQKFIKKAQVFIKKYSWPQMAKETLDIYNSSVA